MSTRKAKKGNAGPTSPFSSEFVRIILNDATLTVHKSFVQDKHKLFDRYQNVGDCFSSPDFAIPLRGVSVHAGHVLVRWLYSGKYELLQETVLNPRETIQTAFAVYSLSRDHGLPELEILAREQISALGDQDSIFTLIDAVEKVYPRTIGRDEWLADYIASRMKTAIKDNPKAVVVPELEREDDGVSVSKIIVRSVMEAYREAREEKSLRQAEHQDAGPIGAKEEHVVEANNGSEYNPASEARKSAEMASLSVELDTHVNTTPETTSPSAPPCNSRVPEVHEEAKIDVDKSETPIKTKGCVRCKKLSTSGRKLCKKCKATALAKLAPEAAPEDSAMPEIATEGSWANIMKEPNQISPTEEVAVVAEEKGRDPWEFWGAKRSPRQSFS